MCKNCDEVFRMKVAAARLRESNGKYRPTDVAVMSIAAAVWELEQRGPEYDEAIHQLKRVVLEEV
jgi:hypothetical protein